MANTKLTIWCNMRYPADVLEKLRSGVGDHRLVLSDRPVMVNLQAGEADPLLGEADVAFGQPPVESVLAHSRLRWAQLSTAGYERFDRAEVREALRRRGGAITTSSTVYSEPCAQHLLAMMLGLARQLPAALDNQRTKRGWPAAEQRARAQVLNGQTVLLVGYGAIARRLVELLRPFEMKIAAVRRSVRGDEVVETHPQERIEELLPAADHVINVLPGGEGTNRFMNAERFARMKGSAIFYNVGRGGTMDQDALEAALRERRIAGAYLDVTDPEPLPSQHSLWKLDNCFITPHTAGGQMREFERIVEHFLGNLGRFEKGEKLRDCVIGDF